MYQRRCPVNDIIKDHLWRQGISRVRNMNSPAGHHVTKMSDANGTFNEATKKTHLFFFLKISALEIVVRVLWSLWFKAEKRRWAGYNPLNIYEHLSRLFRGDVYVCVCVCVCVCVFGFNIAFNNFSVISRQCLVAAGSSMLTFIVLPYWSIMFQTHSMTHPVILSWH